MGCAPQPVDPQKAKEASAKSGLPLFEEVFDPILARCIDRALGKPFDESVLDQFSTRKTLGSNAPLVEFQRAKPNPLNLKPMAISLRVDPKIGRNTYPGCGMSTASREDGVKFHTRTMQALNSRNFTVTKLKGDGNFSASKSGQTLTLFFIARVSSGNITYGMRVYNKGN